MNPVKYAFIIIGILIVVGIIMELILNQVMPYPPLDPEVIYEDHYSDLKPLSISSWVMVIVASILMVIQLIVYICVYTRE